MSDVPLYPFVDGVPQNLQVSTDTRNPNSASINIGILLPNNLRQHRTLHSQKDVLPYALC